MSAFQAINSSIFCSRVWSWEWITSGSFNKILFPHLQTARRKLKLPPVPLFEQQTFIAILSHGNRLITSCIGRAKNFFFGNQNILYIFLKKYILIYDLYCRALAQEPCTGVHEIYNFGRSIIDHHYYIYSLSDLCLVEEKYYHKRSITCSLYDLSPRSSTITPAPGSWNLQIWYTLP